MSASGPSGPLVLSSADSFSKNQLFQKLFLGAILESNGLDPDQDSLSVGPDLGPNRLQRLSADIKSFTNTQT